MNRDIVDDMRQGAAGVLEKTEATAESAKGGILDAVERVTEIYRRMRELGLNDILHTVGLQRRQSPALTLSMFGAGVACGAVLGVAFAPQSGRQSRELLKQRVLRMFDASEEKAHHAVDRAKDGVSEVKEKAHHAADRAKDGMSEMKEKAKEVTANVARTVDEVGSHLPGLKRLSSDTLEPGSNGRRS